MTFSGDVRRLAVGAVGAVLLSVVPPAEHAVAVEVHCAEHAVPVRIAEGGPADQTVVGDLCYLGASPPRTVQLLAAGATYARRYFDPDNGQWTYVDAALNAGYATFAVDRVGTGESSKPPSGQLDVTAGAVALRDVVTKLRAGQVGGIAFPKVVLVAQSLAGAIAWLMGNSADAVVVSNEMHRVNHPGWNSFAVRTATSDPRFAGSGLDSGYVTSEPGVRSLFYVNTDPFLVAQDEATKDLSTLTELGQAFTLVDSADPLTAPSRQLTVPVMVAIGSQDVFFCGGDSITCTTSSVTQQEAPYYANSATFSVAVFNDMAHSLCLHGSNGTFHAAALSWIWTVVPPN